MKNRIALLLFAGISILACTKESREAPVPGAASIEVRVSDATRIQLDDAVRTVWNAGDSVSVFYQGGSDNDLWLYEGADKSAEGKIVSSDYSLAFTTGTTYAVYPYSPSYALDSSRVSLVLPSRWYFVNDGFGSTVMAARSDGGSLTFKYAVSMLCLEIEGKARIDSIIIRGNCSEPLCGPAVLDMSSDVPLVSVDSATAGRELVLCGREGAPALTLRGRARTFIPIPSGTYPGGFTADVVYHDGSRSSIRHTMPVSLEPGQYLKISDYVDETFIVSVTFESDPQTSSSLLYSFPSPAHMGDKDKYTIDIVRSYSFGTPYTFQLWAKTGFSKSTSGGGVRINGLQLNPYTAALAWIKIPSVQGWSLEEIRIENDGKDGQYMNVSSSVDAEGAGTGDLCPDTQLNLSYTSFRLLTPTSEACYLCLGNQKKNAILMSLTMIYRMQ